MQDAGIYMITASPEGYANYLLVQGENPVYSAGNIALAIVQNPNITQFGTAERWKALGRTVKNLELNKGIQIFSRGSFGKGYAISSAYDISQTVGRDLKSMTLKEGSEEMAKALTTVMNYSLVPLESDPELPTPAYYDSVKLELVINPNYPEAEAFSAIAAEVAQSRFHNRGKNIYYNRKESELDAESVSYLLCKRFGIDRDLPDLSVVTDLYNGWTAPEIRQALSAVQDMSKSIGGSIEKHLVPPNRSRSNMHRPVR